MFYFYLQIKEPAVDNVNLEESSHVLDDVSINGNNHHNILPKTHIKYPSKA